MNLLRRLWTATPIRITPMPYCHIFSGRIVDQEEWEAAWTTRIDQVVAAERRVHWLSRWWLTGVGKTLDEALRDMETQPPVRCIGRAA
jgi:hypothetical protein